MRRILCAVDFSDASRKARLEKELRQERVSEDAIRLSEWAQDARQAHVDVQVVIRADGAVPAILEEAEERGVDMIVVGRSGKGATARFLLGSVSRDVAQRAEVPVIVVPD